MNVDGTKRSLGLAFLAVAASFVLSTCYVEVHARGIDSAAAGIVNGAAPSIEHLADARAELFSLQHGLDPRAGQALYATPADVRAIMTRLHAEFEAYRLLPRPADQAPLELTLAGRINDLQVAVDATLAALESGQRELAQSLVEKSVRPNANAVRRGLIRGIEMTAARSQVLAAEIEHGRAREIAFAVALSLLSVGLTGLALRLSLRTVDRFVALTEEHHALLRRRAEELDAFAGRVAHDVLSPLNALSFFTELMSKNDLPTDRRDAAVVRARSALARTQRMVNDLLEFARASAPSPSASTAVGAVLNDLDVALRPEAEHAGCQLELRLEPGLFAACSAGVLTSVVQNLVRNAIKYLGESAERRVEISARTTNGQVRFEVADTGPGLPEGMESAVFEPYVRGPDTHQAGIGLGLATVKRLVEAHRGAVGVISSKRGCTFWVELPVPSVSTTAVPSADPRPASGHFPAHPV